VLITPEVNLGIKVSHKSIKGDLLNAQVIMSPYMHPLVTDIGRLLASSTTLLGSKSLATQKRVLAPA
jgi:hypothetical protein